ncbi:MAG: hypothetical protein SF187_07240 [Deltaproteobacteria bacterium]|nr:hypothetical protein [Deltaproteobacteria bacterium]
MFKAKNNLREGLVLEHELHFENGSFQHCDAQGVPTGPKETRLALSALSCTQNQCAMHDCYFFMLAPFPLPQKVRQDLREGFGSDAKKAIAAVTNRLVPLWDPFTTDTASPKSEKRFVPLDINSPAGISQIFRVHLFDPLDEAILRAQIFQRLNQDWLAETSRLATDAQYRVACHVRALVQGDQDLEELVSLGQIARTSTDARPIDGNGLSYYFLSKEAKSRRLRAALEFAGTAVVRWIGVPQRQCKLPFSLPSLGNNLFVEAAWPQADTYIVSDCTMKELASSPASKISLPPGPPMGGFGNAFAGLFDDHLGDEERIDHLEAVAMACLLDTRGIGGTDDYLLRLLPRLTPHKDEGLADLLKARLDAITTPAGKAKKVWGAWMQIALPVVRAKDQRRWTAFKSRITTASSDPKSPLAKLRDANLDTLSLAGQLANLIVNVDTFWEKREGREAWTALYGAVGFYGSLSSMVGKYRLPEITWSRGIFKGAKLTPVALLLDSVDCVLNIKDGFAKRNNGAVAASAVGAAGAMLGIAGGAVLSGTGVGILFVLASLAVKEVGTRVAAHYDDVKVFLRHTPWGDGNDDEVPDWSGGKPLMLLRADASAQEQALHEILFGTFVAKVAFAGDGSEKDVYVGIEYKGARMPPTAMMWTGSFSISSSTGASWLKLPPDGSVRLAKGEYVKLEGPHRAPAGSWATISSTLNLDVYGDGKVIVKRSFNEKFLSV